MSIIVLLCLLFGVAAILLLVLYFLQRRQLNALDLVSQQLQHIAVGDRLNSRIELHTDQPELASMVSAVNRLIGRFADEADRVAAATAPIGSLGDRVHEAVLIQGETILYANPQFANLMGCSVQELLGHRLEDLVPPDHKELVSDNMRRRLAGEPAAERYEIDLVGRAGQSARLELSSWVVDFQGQRALLIVGVEVLPTQTLQALQDAGGRSRSRRALESLSEALITTDADGRVDYINPAAARLMGVLADDAAGTML
jgi:PAS domain S-box-containing protein